MRDPEINALKLTLQDQLVGYLIGFKNGRNVLHFSSEYKNDPLRPTFSLITHPDFPNAEKLLAKPWPKNQRLHPTLSNLLPEGALRELIAQRLKTHIDNEFQLLSSLGQDLPGALIATPLEPEEVPDSILSTYGKVKAVRFNAETKENKFSLAGIQMKFSMQENNGHYHLTKGNDLGDWIIKTPSTQHKHVPLNEYTAMTLASLAGVNIPDILLVDRNQNKRIHTEDFAQVLVKYPHEKYNAANYEQIAKVLYQFSGEGLADVQQLARRLLVNILLANGDAHLKNWSLLYKDHYTPTLSPAYDIVTTHVYIENETQYALNLGKNKAWFNATTKHFQIWANKSGIPWRTIRPHLDDTLERARSLWPSALENLPMDEAHKEKLKIHWRNLKEDFRIESNK